MCCLEFPDESQLWLPVSVSGERKSDIFAHTFCIFSLLDCYSLIKIIGSGVLSYSEVQTFLGDI
jgi:hypothetical protein